MKPENLRTIFFSPTGTSRKIAEAVARGFSAQAKTISAPAEADEKYHPDAAASAADAGPDEPTGRNGADDGNCTAPSVIDLTHSVPRSVLLSRDSVAVIAVPVYGGKVAPTARKRLETVHGDGTPAVLIVLYGNRAFEGALAELSGIAAAQGFVPIAAAAFVGEHSYSSERYPIAAGRPDADDLAQAEAFGRRTAGRLAAAGSAETNDCTTECGFVAVDVRRIAHPSTGFRPTLRFIRFVLGYRRRQKRRPVVYLPATDPAACTHCGRCVALCPVGAIAKGDEEHTDPARCIRCCACVKGCPVRARTFETPFAAALSRNFRKPKPNVFLPR